MMFADYVVLCNKTIHEAKERLEVWRKVLEERGMKISRKKTEYFSLVPERYKRKVSVCKTLRSPR